MKKIEITDQMYASLMELSKEINSQDHRATRMPYFFQVQTNEEVAVPYGQGTQIWHYDGSTIETEEEINEAIDDYRDDNLAIHVPVEELDQQAKEMTLEEAGWQKGNRDYSKMYQNSFFTAKACKEHIARNKHHYREPVDFLSYAFRNPEMELVMKFLCELSGGELHK